MDLLLSVIVIYVFCQYFSVLFPEYVRLWNILACLLTALLLLGYVVPGLRRG